MEYFVPALRLAVVVGAGLAESVVAFRVLSGPEQFAKLSPPLPLFFASPQLALPKTFLASCRPSYQREVVWPSNSPIPPQSQRSWQRTQT